MVVLSIDVGFNGGLVEFAIAKDCASVLSVNYYKMPVIVEKERRKRKRKQLDITALKEIMAVATHVLIEDVHSHKGEGVVSVFRFGEQKGILKGIAYCLEKQVYFISPVSWKRFWYKREGIRTKKDGIEYVKKVTGWKLRKMDDGIADAYLMGLYWLYNNSNMWGVNK